MGDQPFFQERIAMRLIPIPLAVVLVFAAFSAYGGQPDGSPPPTNQSPGKPTDNKPADNKPADNKPADNAKQAAIDKFRFAPMWMPVPKFPPARHFPPASEFEAALPVPSAAYAEIWQPQWQEELGLSVEQKKKLLAVNAKALADANAHAEQFKKLSPEEQQAQVKSWAGKSAPWRQQLDIDICRQIESVLTPEQLQTLKDMSFPEQAVGLLYDATMRREIDFTAAQETGFRRLAKERLARIQEVTMERAEKLWSLLTPPQQAALPEVVKRQGPTSAILSIAWEVGFDYDGVIFSYPMLAVAPARERLGLNAEQVKQLHAVTADSAASKERARQERLPKPNQPSQSASDWEAIEKKGVEAILSPQQLTMLNEINFRRQVALALSYPEKRKTVGITAQQATDIQRLDKETHQRLYRIDREMLGQALETLTPQQRERLRGEIDRLPH